MTLGVPALPACQRGAISKVAICNVRRDRQGRQARPRTPQQIPAGGFDCVWFDHRGQAVGGVKLVAAQAVFEQVTIGVCDPTQSARSGT